MNRYLADASDFYIHSGTAAVNSFCYFERHKCFNPLEAGGCDSVHTHMFSRPINCTMVNSSYPLVKHFFELTLAYW